MSLRVVMVSVILLLTFHLSSFELFCFLGCSDMFSPDNVQFIKCIREETFLCPPPLTPKGLLSLIPHLVLYSILHKCLKLSSAT